MKLVVLAMVIGSLLGAQTAREGAALAGPSVTPPRVIRKLVPKYTPAALGSRIQGTVVLQLVIDSLGEPTRIEVISPLGFGLDEQARETVARWRFEPARSGDTPVPMRSTIEVSFRLPGRYFDTKMEKRRTRFNVALQALRRPRDRSQREAVRTMVELANEKFPAALHVVGTWEVAGDNLAKDESAGWAKIRKAAEKNHGPAIFELARHSLEESAEDQAAWDEMRRAAVLGSVDAQFYLGDRHERGAGVERSEDRARNYFRLCAATGQPECQYRLGKLLFNNANRRDYEYEQALAWFQLAAEKRHSAARAVAEREKSDLNPEQKRRIEILTRQFAGNLR